MLDKAFHLLCLTFPVTLSAGNSTVSLILRELRELRELSPRMARSMTCLCPCREAYREGGWLSADRRACWGTWVPVLQYQGSR